MSDPGDRLSQLRIDREAEHRPASPWPRRAGLAVAAVALTAGAWWWVFGRDTALPVETAPVTRGASAGSGASVLDASGYVTARRQATVSSKVTGKIAEVLVEEGLRVEEGQVLARLDDAMAQRALALAEAELASSASDMREIEVRRQEAALDLGRTEELAAAGVSSQSALDAARAELDSLVARIAAAQDDVAVAERMAALRRQELEDTVIRAPFAGIAISKNAQPGEMISPTSAGGGFTRTGVTTIVDMDSLEIEVDVNEAFIHRVEPDQRVVATLDAYPDWKIPAHVITTIPAADRQRATVKVRIGFDQLGDPRILPDMGVKVSFQAAPEEGATSAPSALLVPSDAVHREGEMAVVFVAKEGVVERRAVALGAERGDSVEVLSGLREGERVVLDPPADLGDGDRVRDG